MAQRVRRLTRKHAYLEYGTEIGCAVTDFRGPIVLVVVSLYRGGAFVVFCKRLHQDMETAAVAGLYASVIGGALAAAVVFAREVSAMTENDSRVTARDGRGQRDHQRQVGCLDQRAAIAGCWPDRAGMPERRPPRAIGQRRPAIIDAGFCSVRGRPVEVEGAGSGDSPGR